MTPADYMKRWVALAVSHDETRESINRVWLEPGRRWATDGHRVHLAPDASLTAHGAEPAAPLNVSAPPIDQVVPVKGFEFEVLAWPFAHAIEEAAKLDDDEARKETRSRAVGLRRYGMRAKGSPKDLAPLVTGPYVLAVVTVKGSTLWQSASVGGLGDACVVVDEKTWHCNARYLLEALKYAPRGGTVRVRWPDFKRLRRGTYRDPKWSLDSTAPLKLTHTDGRVAVIMPIRIGW